ncbi:hypothetical protein NLM24_05460 [Nocardia zapadnayensis]|uniref:hypothetical protein n=1 Tax=Nocardia rhamnosiphila TaxID=426716 RepID=UPI002247CB3F|nr:hypothetical protein [Nocardia zapadnayensis]MCX0270160.1 hypothetical protein [Nocardia zapadnayensis]
MSSPEPVHDLARGDLGVSRQLSKALQVIMAGTTDPRLKDQIRAILDGRASARELLHSDAFNVVLDQTMPAAMQQFAEMPEEERQRLAAQGQRQLDQLRDQPSTWSAPAQSAEPPVPRSQVAPQPPASPAGSAQPGRRGSYRDEVVTPDEPDEDDLYFRDRWKNGWLQ